MLLFVPLHRNYL